MMVVLFFLDAETFDYNLTMDGCCCLFRFMFHILSFCLDFCAVSFPFFPFLAWR